MEKDQEVEFLRGKVQELTSENEHLKSALGLAKEYISHVNGDLKNVVLKEIDKRERDRNVPHQSP